MEQFAMGAYDSPGYQDQLPGFGPRNSHDYMTAPGSQGAVQSERGGGLGTVVVTTPGSSSQAPQPLVDVGPGETGAFADDVAVHEPLDFTGVTGASQTGAGRGRAQNDHLHVNSHGVGP